MNFLSQMAWPMFLLLFAAAMLALYLAREPAHRAINAITRGLANATRLVARSLGKSASKLRERNREVLLNLGQEHSEREISRQFHEISQFVQKDLGGYPKIQQDIREQITAIQADYEQSQIVPAEMPEWTEAVDSVAKLKNGNANANAKLLEQIHATAQTQHKANLKEHRETTAKRHQILQKMLPYWRKLSFSIEDTGNRLREIIERSEKIDTHMARFNELQSGSDKALNLLRSSAMVQLIISAFVIAIAAGGAFFNFHLIALPMSEMVGSVQRIGGVKVSDLAALVIICLEISAGIFLLESLRITRLFPLIGSMDDRGRRAIMIASAGVLITLACTESALAFMRDQIANDLSALRASLSGSEEILLPQAGANHWIPLAANMILGFVLPLALTMIAIPLEYLLQSGRTVLGNLFANLIGGLALLIRLISSGFKQTGVLFISLYDLLIAGPLFIEHLITNAKKSESTQDDAPWVHEEESFETIEVKK